jgi:hypothetical protein
MEVTVDEFSDSLKKKGGGGGVGRKDRGSQASLSRRAKVI